MRCANAERHVESRDFAASVEHDFDAMLSAVSPRRVWDGSEKGDRERYVKLRRALRQCRYVYLVDGWERDPMCVRLKKSAWWQFKAFIQDEED
jgi:hypothetical protein